MAQKVLLVYPNLMLISTLPNNVSLLAAVLKEDGHEVGFFDATLYRTAEKSNDEMRVERMQVRRFNIKDQGVSLKEHSIFDAFISMVDEFKPDLVAVTVVDDTVTMGLNLVRAAECRRRGIPVIFGGVHAFFNAKRLLENPEVDMVCVGEGEKTLGALCRNLEGKLPLEDVPTLWFKDKDGRIIKNPMATTADLNTLPYEDFSIFEEQRFYRPMQGRMYKMLPINFDRGCPYQCRFCDAPAINAMYKEKTSSKYYRQKSFERISAEIRHQLSTYNVEYLYFNSETFLAMSLEKLSRFAQMYSEFKLPFWCQTNIETVTDEKIRLLKEMNCDRISIGLEHGNEDYRRNVLKKRFTNAAVLRAFEIFNKYEMKVSVNNILGFPDETRELIFDTIKLNRQIKADSINGFIFQPYTGTELRDYCIKQGYLPEGAPATDTPIGNPVLDMPQISKKELEGLLRTFVLYVKMPKSYYPKIKVAEQMNAEGNATLSELREIFFEKYFT